MMDGRYNTRSPAVKRLMREAQELSEPTDQYFAQPLDDNLFEWHFTIRGPADSDFQNGIYHGRIILPVDYPMKPPSIIWLTPNGRFETFKKICLSISGHHPESWQPSWSIRTALLAIIGFMPTHPGGAIGALDYTPEERKLLAKKSREWKCPTCGDVQGVLLDASPESQQTSNEAKELAAQINLQGEKPKCKDGECPIEQARQAELQAAAQSVSTAPVTQASQPVSETSQEEETINSNAACNSASNTQALPTFIPAPPTHESIPFSQWSTFTNPYPMPPFGFPFQFPGMSIFPPLSHFPYPPSHYTAMMQQHYHYPQSGVQQSPSANFSSPGLSEPSPESTENVSSNMNVQYSRTPMTSPSITRSSQPATGYRSTNEENVITSQQDGQKEKRGDVFKELLCKVKRVGSNPTTDDGSNTANRSEDVTSQLKTLTLPKQFMEEDTDSDVSKSMKKIGDASVSDKGNTNTEDISEDDAPPIDAEENIVVEKGASSSTPELERWKRKKNLSKGLRHHQSAMASVSSAVSEEGNVEAERIERSNGGSSNRPRIEASSGDTVSRNRHRHGSARIVNTNNVLHRAANHRQIPQRTYDFSFFLMVGLLSASIVILLNRLIIMDWDLS